MNRLTPVHELKGIGEKTEKLFIKLGIHTVGDLVQYYPRGYDVYEEAVPVSELVEGRVQTVTGAIFGRVHPPSEGYQRHPEGGLVPHAFSAEHAGKGRSHHPAGPGVQEKERPCHGAPGDLLSILKV